MDYVGRLKRVNGHEVTFEFDERPDIEELSRFSNNDTIKAEVTFDDNRTITAEQRKKAWALINDIARHTGYTPLDAADWMKAYFMADTGGDVFSLSNCSVTTARLFITYIIDFCFRWGIPFKNKGMDMHDDINKYLYLCIKYRKCVICGQKADIHHTESVGAGRDRRIIDHSKHPMMALCRRHHVESHQIGQQTFNQKHMVQGIKLTRDDIKRFGIGR